jgi:sulfate adenylyltransferase subunit 2
MIKCMISAQLYEKEQKSIYIIREAFASFEKKGMLWSMGKDSMTLLWLIRKAFLGKVPISILHLDTGYKFPEMITFRDQIAREWNLDLKIIRPPKQKSAMRKNKIECCHHHKTLPFLKAIKDFELDVIYLGIRSDEHGVRAKEQYFSLRGEEGGYDVASQPLAVWDFYPQKKKKNEHFRIHPLLHWSEQDVWEYIQQENIPIPKLYFSKNGRRYRSLGCVPCCQAIPSKAKTIKEIIREIKTSNSYERQGRSQDKEDENAMEKLRSLGYM